MKENLFGRTGTVNYELTDEEFTSAYTFDLHQYLVENH